MNFISTRNSKTHYTISEAILLGLATDGGLFMPEYLPQMDANALNAELSLSEYAAMILDPFFESDALKNNLPKACNDAFTFPAPVTSLNDRTHLLELFHGPTSSFKDFGARFLAECLNHLAEHKKITILVATSGDTGSAVASAFHNKPNIHVIILYPKGQISKRQEHQITCWDNNILALAVNGTFDDCQHLVKSAFQDEWFKKNTSLNSANSINIGRLLPQMTYYAKSSTAFKKEFGEEAGYIVPTGNLGNAAALYFAKIMGFPIREIVLSTNANRVIPDYLMSGKFEPRPSIATLANAMDVGNPSNFERLRHLFNTFESFKKNVLAFSVSDEEIKKAIQDVYKKFGKFICPHTATGYAVREQLSEKPWIIAATADASKFENIIEPLLGKPVPVSAELQFLLRKQTHFREIKNDLNALKEAAANMK